MRGTVASVNAYRSLAPCRMIPVYSCSVPGRNPGTSTNAISGMLKASQKRTKRAPEDLWLVGDDPNRVSGEAGKPADDVPGPVSMNLEELPVIEYGADYLV